MQFFSIYKLYTFDKGSVILLNSVKRINIILES
jgi:hypothetical protein